MYWIIIAIIFVVLIVAYGALFFYSRKRQKSFDQQYLSMKERREVFVLSKKIVRERARQSGALKFAKVKTYQVSGRVALSQQMRGMQMTKMQVVQFHTTKAEYDKIQVNHKYKMDIAGNYIGYVIAPMPTKPAPQRKKADSKTVAEAKGRKKKNDSGAKSK